MVGVGGGGGGGGDKDPVCRRRGPRQAEANAKTSGV